MNIKHEPEGYHFQYILKRSSRLIKFKSISIFTQISEMKSQVLFIFRNPSMNYRDSIANTDGKYSESGNLPTGLKNYLTLSATEGGG